MSPKSIALLVVGMVLVSSVFFIFHVSYPSNPATIKINHVPKNVNPQNIHIFQNQSYNLPKLGLNQTSFTPSGNTSMILQGYVYNASSPGGKQPIANTILGVAVMQALTRVQTNSEGFYQVRILASGQGTFAFKMFQYITDYQALYIGQGLTVLNKTISLTPQPKESVSGITLSHGNNIPGVSLTFKNFWGNYTPTSDNTGAYSLNMVNGNYTITALKSGFEPLPDPSTVAVSSSPISNLNLNLNATNQGIYYMNGSLFNQLGQKVPNALVFDSSPHVANGSDISNSYGFYNISVAYYMNQIQIGATGYTPFSQNVEVLQNMTKDFYNLEALDPFNAPNGVTGITKGEPAGLANNISKPGYTPTPTNIFISGQVISTQTGNPVPNQSFDLFTSVNGTYFNDTIVSNSTGYYKVNLLFTGDYHLNVTSAQFYDTWLNESLVSSQGNVPIYVTTSPNKVYHLSGGVINGVTGKPLSNATIKIYSSSGGYLTSVQTNATGYFNTSLLGGSYKISVSSPGYSTTNQTLTISGNTTLPTVNITPTTSISPGSSQWNSSSGSGLPGVNGSSISAQLNNTQNLTGISPGTNSSTPVTLHIRMMINGTSLSVNNTTYEMFVRVNGLTLNLTGNTNKTGYSLLNLAYGGSYILLPEMVDYSGIAELVNTSEYQNNQTLDLYLNPLLVYNVTANLTNPLPVYNGSSVPVGGLTVTGYILPITPDSTPYMGGNYTIFNYSLPNGTYSFQYSNIHYVPKKFSINVNGSSNYSRVVLQPYVLKLSWNTNASWYYTLNGPGISLTNTSKLVNSSTYISLESGTYSFNTYLGNNQSNTTSFSLTANAPNKSLQFITEFGVQTNSNVTTWNFNGTKDELQVNTSIGHNEVYYISQVDINANLSKNSFLYIASKETGSLNQTTFSSFAIANYFATSKTGQTSLSIVSNGFKDYNALSGYAQYGVNVTIAYYTTSLTG